VTPETSGKRLAELSVTDNSDLQLEHVTEKRVEEKGDTNEPEPEDLADESNLISVLVERDDEIGMTRYCKHEEVIFMSSCRVELDAGIADCIARVEDEPSSWRETQT
jgi:hypothetical protein